MHWKKSWYLYNKVERTWKDDIMKIIMAVNYFRKTLHRRCLIRSWIYEGSEYARVQSMSLALNMKGFWIYEWSEYVRVIQDSEYTWIVAAYAKLCLNMSSYAGICLKSTWIAFALHCLIVISCLLECVITYFNVYWKIDSLKKHKAVFLTRQNLIFSIVAGIIWFNFCFRRNVFTSRISNMLLFLGAEVGGGRESWYTYD